MFSARQLWALVRAVARDLGWGLAATAREVRAWRARALAIPDAPLRSDALSALGSKRGQTDGAALLCTLPRARHPSLLRTFVAYQIVWDFLDSVNEHGAAAGEVNGRQLHLALREVFDRRPPASDYYLHHPWRRDGGYLRTLVATCRESCAQLPSFARVQPVLVQEAARAQVLALNHDPDPARREAALRAWAAREFPGGHEAAWFELTGAASAGLTIFALLALACEPECAESDIARVRDAYFPWIATAATMLDSYVDQLEDAANGDHRYVDHYSTPDLAVRRIGELVQRCLAEARALPHGERHVVIAACMVALYLSKDVAFQSLPVTGGDLLEAGGSLTRLLLPVLRLWRIAYHQRST